MPTQQILSSAGFGAGTPESVLVKVRERTVSTRGLRALSHLQYSRGRKERAMPPVPEGAGFRVRFL
jgi:hypothetical protein